MLDILILAIALSMDAFAVSIGLGAKIRMDLKTLALRTAVYFGFFQGAMPLIGYFGGAVLSVWVDTYADWIAFFLLVFIGGKMIYESIWGEEESTLAHLTHKTLLILAIATSIDAMAAGYAIRLMSINIFVACLIIGVTTFLFSFCGALIGRNSGRWLESKAGVFGGIVLVLIGLKLLLT